MRLKKGQTYEQAYGIEKANQLKELRRISRKKFLSTEEGRRTCGWSRDLTHEEAYGKEKSLELRKNLSIGMSDSNHPAHTRESIEKMRQKKIGKPSARKGQIQTSCLGNKNPAKRPEVRAKISKRRSEIAIACHQTPFGKCCYRQDLKKTFRSRWEANFARLLNYIEEPWEYEKQSFVLQFIDKNMVLTCSYRPDFYLPRLGKYFEIKGYETPEFKIKIVGLKEQYPSIKVVILRQREYEQLEDNFGKYFKHWEFSTSESVETVRQLPLNLKEMIQSELFGNKQNSAEMTESTL